MVMLKIMNLSFTNLDKIYVVWGLLLLYIYYIYIIYIYNIYIYKYIYIYIFIIYYLKSQQTKPNISLCFTLIATSDLKAASSFSSSFQSLQLVMNHKVNYGLVKSKVQIKIRNATCCNNRDDLLHLSFTLKISIFSEAYI